MDYRDKSAFYSVTLTVRKAISTTVYSILLNKERVSVEYEARWGTEENFCACKEESDRVQYNISPKSANE